MSAILLMIPMSGIIAYAPVDTPSHSNNEIIIVSLDDFDSTSADQLSQYVLRLFEDRVNAQITITKYIGTDKDCDELGQVIDNLSKHVDADAVIHVIQEDKPLDAPHDYFSVKVAGPKAIQ